MATLLLVNSLLLLPVWILNGGPRPHLLALEAGVVVGLFLLLPRRRWSRVAAWIVSGATVTVTVLEVADTATRLSLDRPLNLYLDVQLLRAVSNLLRGTLGTVGGVLVMGIALALIAGLAVGLARLLSSLRNAGSRRQTLAGAVVLVVSLALILGRWVHPAGVVVGLPSAQLVREQSDQLARMLGERERFASELASSPSRYDSLPGLLDGLGGRDVIMAFIESYGMSAVRDPRYAPIVRPRLEAMADTLEARGLHVASGRLVAPSQGGMSWLGRGSVLSGLWLENQLRYDLLLASDRGTLIDDFEAAGYRTAAVMPAITMAWPEGERFGYDRIYARKDIDYAGPPLNWVTMPDQFTWSFLERVVRSGSDERPLFAEVGLISSHAPWTPILPVLDDWDRIGDGSVFAAWADAGEAPEVLWRDQERVREHYALSIGYVVDVLASYAARFVDDGTLLVALGDHQPAPLITGEHAPRSVPIHVVASDPALIQPFLDWGFAVGGVPDAVGLPARMDEVRAWFIEAFSTASRSRP